MQHNDTNIKLSQQLKSGVFWILGFIMLIWAVELINLTIGHRLCRWGVLPRTLQGLIGIPLSPFLHFGISHVLLNTLPFIVLGGFVILQGTRQFVELSLFVIFLGGIAIWLFGRSSYHVGASGLIFGYFGFLVASGWYDRRLSSFLVAFLTLFLYGGILWGLLPIFPHLSWEGHFFGLLSGILGARFVKSK